MVATVGGPVEALAVYRIDLKVIEIVKRGQHRKSLDKLFQGFKPAVESCYFNWEAAYQIGRASCRERVSSPV